MDRERDSGEVGLTWMLTIDVDDFLWFDRELARGPANEKDALLRLLSELSSGDGEAMSVRISSCVYGPSGDDARGSER